MTHGDLPLPLKAPIVAEGKFCFPRPLAGYCLERSGGKDIRFTQGLEIESLSREGGNQEQFHCLSDNIDFLFSFKLCAIKKNTKPKLTW